MATIQEQASSHKYIITFVVMSATIMQVLDTTIVNVALPDMQGALNASPDEIAWVLTSYIVASAIFMPLTGYISDKIGRKKYLLGSMIGFTIASMFCGLSQNLSELVAFRLLQGVFGASLVPLSQAILAHTYPPEERGRAMAIWGMGVMLGPVLGPTLGGYFAEYMTWRWNFYVNVPVGIVTIILAIFYIDETEIKERSLDWFGFGLLALGIGMLQFTLDRGNQDNWFESNVICATAVLAFLGLSSFAVYSKYFAKNPIFNVEVLTNRNFYAASIIIAFLIMGLYGAMVLQPIMLNNLFYYPEFTIGLAMVPRGLASMFSMLFVPKLMSIMHPRYIVLIGIALSMFGNYVQTYYTLEADLFWMVWPLVFQGFGLGLTFIPLSTMCLSSIPNHLINEASGLYSLMRVLGSSAGISIIITYFTRQTQASWNELGGFINPYNENLTQYLQALNLNPTDPLAMQILGKELSIYSQMQGMIDSYFLITFCFIVMLPLIFLFERRKIKNQPVVTLD